MRLIHAETCALVDFAASTSVPPYAILSHTWGDGNSEVTFQDFQNYAQAQQKAGFVKIRNTCIQALRDGLEYAWVDTCCINKDSSTELQEAINSMYRYYTNATVCYCLLTDVPGNCPPLNDDYLHPSQLRFVEAFEDSRWFTRGWTLQELIAPRRVHFFGNYFNHIGALPQLIERVSHITGIQKDVLNHSKPLSDLSIARRLSWAAKRQTTRVEDQAYSLFGILDVNMPLLYGEGDKAFQRLQEHIIAQSTDQSILAWDAPAGPVNSRELLLAPSPKCFANGGRIRRRRGTASELAFRMGNNGLEIKLPIMRRRLRDDSTSPQIVLGILDCKYEGSPYVLALAMSQHPFVSEGGNKSVELYVSGYERRRDGIQQYARLLPVLPAEIADASPTQLTITKDLRSRMYVQDFSINDPSWFPVRFTGDEWSSLLCLQDVYPDQCWSATSRTLRLRPPEQAFGGIIVETSFSGAVLVTFGVECSSRSPPTRKIYDIVPIHPQCAIRPHLRLLMETSRAVGTETVRFPLRKRQRLVAQVYLGAALTISVESRGVPGPMSPPSSPTLSRTSTASSWKRDSVLQDSSPSPASASQEEGPSKLHVALKCRNCQALKARGQAERQQAEREESRAKQRKRARQVGASISVGSILAGIADLDGLDFFL